MKLFAAVLLLTVSPIFGFAAPAAAASQPQTNHASAHSRHHRRHSNARARAHHRRHANARHHAAQTQPQ